MPKVVLRRPMGGKFRTTLIDSYVNENEIKIAKKWKMGGGVFSRTKKKRTTR